jgi:hypothetical protein
VQLVKRPPGARAAERVRRDPAVLAELLARPAAAPR